jgi:hypothetical protein
MDRSAAIDKIRKLLATSGRTEAEADTAQILAACLAEKHGIDIAAVDLTDPSREIRITHRAFGEWASVPDEATYASLICKRFFEVSPFESGKLFIRHIIFVGTDQHITIAGYVFEFLIGEFRRAWTRRANKRLKKRKAFIYGCYVAVFSKLLERFERPQSNQPELALELSLSARREKYIEENFGEMSSSKIAPKARTSMAAQHGLRAGQSIEIRPAVNGNHRRPDQLPAPVRLLTNS